MAVGQRCLGEHHSQVLARQKDIITQLRLRVSDTEDASNPTLDFAGGLDLQVQYYMYV